MQAKFHENHKKDQYLFDADTIKMLADFVSKYQNPCCLCTPSIGAELEKRKRIVTVLDIDDRFSHLKGYTKYDLYKPQPMGEFDLIICDPPFKVVTLSQLFRAIKILSTDYDQPLMVSYLKRRTNDIVATFDKFKLVPTNFHPQYQIPQHPTNVEFFSNLGESIVSCTK